MTRKYATCHASEESKANRLRSSRRGISREVTLICAAAICISQTVWADGPSLDAASISVAQPSEPTQSSPASKSAANLSVLSGTTVLQGTAVSAAANSPDLSASSAGLAAAFPIPVKPQEVLISSSNIDAMPAQIPSVMPLLDMADLEKHPDRWISPIRLTKPLVFPAISNGRSVGSVEAPAGSAVELISVTGGKLRLRYVNGEILAPVDFTDLASQILAVQSRASSVPRQRVESIPASTPMDTGSPYASDTNSYDPGDGEVYVHGYFRKNGTYVQGYYRRR
jgi:hypothetical protein